MEREVSDSTAEESSGAAAEEHQDGAGMENASGDQSVDSDLVEKIIHVVVVDCNTETKSGGERGADAPEMRNDGSDNASGESPHADVETSGREVEGPPLEKIIDVVVVDCTNKLESARDSSACEECRVCRDENDEALIDLGCDCRGALAKAHLSCITRWFQTRGSNKCEVCRRVATNVSPHDSHYWIWRVDPAHRDEEYYQRNSCRFVSASLVILMFALALDILISTTFGLSAIPTNIIFGAMIFVGLIGSVRIAVEYLGGWNGRRGAQLQPLEANHFGPAYLPPL
ncbi:uncharacterized protein LOC127260922 [Andrographis paniculata]|uniref:uncharacterized protein LOC127260922 n=1 Tax=Andrographis paniculata TaxID=175694 RepID=UPI0021E93F91|nr:uncharacterized protein LOC127260922 [Andrographis paniculata]